jgi:hypothetical protein
VESNTAEQPPANRGSDLRTSLKRGKNELLAQITEYECNTHRTSELIVLQVPVVIAQLARTGTSLSVINNNVHK